MKRIIIIALLAANSPTCPGQVTASGNVSIEAYRTIKDLELKNIIASKDLIGMFKFQAGSYL